MSKTTIMHIHLALDEITLGTPALLFSAISLIMLAYTNRFLSYTQVIRNLKDRYLETEDENYFEQIETLKKRLFYIRRMQWLGTSSLFLCVLSMFVIYVGLKVIAAYIFAIALVILALSLAYSVWEIQISSRSIDLHLKDIENN